MGQFSSQNFEDCINKARMRGAECQQAKLAFNEGTGTIEALLEAREQMRDSGMAVLDQIYAGLDTIITDKEDEAIDAGTTPKVEHVDEPEVIDQEDDGTQLPAVTPIVAAVRAAEQGPSPTLEELKQMIATTDAELGLTPEDVARVGAHAPTDAEDLLGDPKDVG